MLYPGLVLLLFLKEGVEPMHEITLRAGHEAGGQFGPDQPAQAEYKTGPMLSLSEAAAAFGGLVGAQEYPYLPVDMPQDPKPTPSPKPTGPGAPKPVPLPPIRPSYPPLPFPSPN